MKNFVRLSVCMAAVIAVSGCKTGVDASFFTSDVIAVAREGQPVDVTVTLSVEAISDEKCAEHQGVVADALATGFGGVTFLECRKVDMNTTADFRVTVPMVRPNTKTDSALAFWADETAGRIGVALKPDQAKIDAIVSALPREMTSLVSGPLEPAIRLTVLNDLTAPVTVIMQGAFIDGQPYQLEKETELARRDEVRIVLSDVGNAAFHSGGSLMFVLKAP